jgi:hypothetical protein
MKQFIFILITVVILPVYAYSQTLIQTFTDPCTKVVSTFSIPITGSATIVFYNKSKAFTASDVYSGAFQAWINQVYEEYKKLSPCSVAQAAQTSTIVTASAVSSAVSGAVSSAVSGAASSAASSAASAAASSASGSVSTGGGDTGGGGSTSSSESSSSESSSGESKSESKSESKGGGGKSSKSGGKSQAKMNPILFNSDLTAGQTIDNSVNLIVTSGISQTSMAGDVSWGVTGMVWSNLQQFALSGRYTKMNFDGGKLSRIDNSGATLVHAFGNTFGFLTYAQIYPLGKWGVTGVNATLAIQKTPDQFTTTHSLLVFYTKPFQVNKRLTISPDIYISGSPVTYGIKDNTFTISEDMMFLTGFNVDYSITKRFKFNTGLKTSVSTNPDIPMLFFAVVGSKVNL